MRTRLPSKFSSRAPRKLVTSTEERARKDHQHVRETLRYLFENLQRMRAYVQAVAAFEYCTGSASSEADICIVVPHSHHLVRKLLMEVTTR